MRIEKFLICFQTLFPMFGSRFLEVMLLAGKIEVKDDLQILADFMLEMILKYGNKVDVDSLPEPEVYFLVQSIKKLNKLMVLFSCRLGVDKLSLIAKILCYSY